MGYLNVQVILSINARPFHSVQATRFCTQPLFIGWVPALTISMSTGRAG